MNTMQKSKQSSKRFSKPPEEILKGYLTIKQYCELYKISLRTFHYKVESGEIITIKMLNRTLIKA